MITNFTIAGSKPCWGRRDGWLRCEWLNVTVLFRGIGKDIQELCGLADYSVFVSQIMLSDNCYHNTWQLSIKCIII